MAITPILNSRTQLAKWILAGVAFLFLIQNGFLVASFLVFGEYKQGLINARLLVLESLQAWPVISALLQSFAVSLLLLCVTSAAALLCAILLVDKFLTRESPIKLFFLLLLLSYASLMLINVYHYPNSNAKLAYFSALAQSQIQWPYYLAIALLALINLMAFIQLLFVIAAWYRRKPFFTPGRKLPIVALLVAVVGVFLVNNKDSSVAFSAENKHSDRPNIILIGLDSVRPDVLSNEFLAGKFMPNVQAFLSAPETVHFTNAYVPIARTFPAWHTILSGLFPRSSGVRYNLQQLSSEQKLDTIVAPLRDKGYYAIYGSDEKRFSVIDESYGFDKTIGPPPGAAEWILSVLEDSPLHNLYRDTPLAPILFPHTHANRASFTVYKPTEFVSEVRSVLSAVDTSAPLFLSLHLCLSHWPYTWAEEQHDKGSLRQYFDSLGTLDAQFEAVVEMLAQLNLLENSVLFVFSDHGEAFPAISAEPEGSFSEEIARHLPLESDRTMGHGTDLTTLSQNQVLLSLQDGTGQNRLDPGTYDRLVSLADIAPTIAEAVKVTDFESDGLSLWTMGSEPFEKRPVFLETGFDLAVLHKAEIDIDALLEHGASTYEISDDGYLQLKDEFHADILKNKQKGVTDGQFLVTSSNPVVNPGEENTKRFVVDILAPQQVRPIEHFPANAEINWLRDQFEFHFGDEL